ncbi:MAG: alanine--tRNA ligase [Planctomycetota bacterium]|nr:alanine--tRNA ligase [Planctomycetota bacterium]MDA1140764.1 alanine--tRNA ligase [Planctomycetota bacterium]
MRTASEIRQTFLDFFKDKGHEIVRSAPVFPKDDPTLLFTNAGMNQFKDVFLGTGTRPYSRAVDTQKCIRVSGKHNDLEEVGVDTYHHTLFEMLGNWSFGDYYKQEAILWAWELLTGVFGLPKDRLWATVHHSDDEAMGLWREMTDINPEHVLKFGDKDNFWMMGETGPCGPCSELHIDLTENGCTPADINADRADVIELWNLVFIQYNRQQDGTDVELPFKHVDTGMGMERLTAVLQGKSSNYDTDIFRPLLDTLSEICGRPYEGANRIAMRVIVDHVRALSFAIADGALPSNAGRGYVLRRLLRRASRFGRTLELNEPFIYRIVATLVREMGGFFPELAERQDHIERVIKGEEESFGRTLHRGLELFENVAGKLKESTSTVFPGHEAFKLYDTYGFPSDLTELMAREIGIGVDMVTFDQLMNEQKDRARAAGKAKLANGAAEEWQVVREGEHSEFTGYESLTEICNICEARRSGDQFHVVLNRTPFYAESGGQSGDRGTLIADDFLANVVDTWKEGDRFVHLVDSLPEDMSVELTGKVDTARRLNTMRNHTATHLMHAALRETVGEHARQAGSMVSPERLRFDFTHFEGVTPAQIEEIERQVNQKIREDLVVQTKLLSFDEARAAGAMALFGEKYGDTVRMVSVGDYSLELCGGTHLKSTGQTGHFKILSEGSIASGVRRIEAVTGDVSAEILLQEQRMLSQVKAFFPSARFEDIPKQIESLIEERKYLEKELKKLKSESASSGLGALVEAALHVNGVKVIASKIESDSPDELRDAGNSLRQQLGSGVGVLAAAIGDKVNIVAVVTDDLVKTVQAGKIVGAVAKIVGGGGGGKPHMAQAGGKDPSKLDEALKAVPGIVQEMMG